ncbi:MAG: adenylate kinase [Myxococcota bacterium]
MMQLVLLGPPGAGKGTQAKLIEQHFGLVHMSTGDALRRIQADPSHPLADALRQILRTGQLVPDDVVMQVVRDRLREPNRGNGYVLDGFPRTVPQAEMLESLLHGTGQRLTGVVSLTVATETLVQRLSTRWSCPQCGMVYQRQTQAQPNTCTKDNQSLIRRSDDDPNAVRRRLRVFARQTAPLESFYAQRGQLYRVDAQGIVQEVWQRVQQQLNRLSEQPRLHLRQGIGKKEAVREKRPLD